MTDTLANLEAAIQAHIAESRGALTLSWALITQAQAIDENEGGSFYRIVIPDAQQFHTTQGLIRVGDRCLDDIWNEDDDD